VGEEARVFVVSGVGDTESRPDPGAALPKERGCGGARVQDR